MTLAGTIELGGRELAAWAAGASMRAVDRTWPLALARLVDSGEAQRMPREELRSLLSAFREASRLVGVVDAPDAPLRARAGEDSLDRPRVRRSAAKQTRVLMHAIRLSCPRIGDEVRLIDLVHDAAFREAARETIRQAVRRSPEFVWLAGEGGASHQRKAAIRRVAGGRA